MWLRSLHSFISNNYVYQIIMWNFFTHLDRIISDDKFIELLIHSRKMSEFFLIKYPDNKINYGRTIQTSLKDVSMLQILNHNKHTIMYDGCGNINKFITKSCSTDFIDKQLYYVIEPEFVCNSSY